MKRRNSSRGKQSKIDREGIPRLLRWIRTEPLSATLTLKVWPTLAVYLNRNGGPALIRRFIVDGLQRVLDQPTKAVCRECANLDRKQNPPFCISLLAYLDRGPLNQVWDCELFQPKKRGS